MGDDTAPRITVGGPPAAVAIAPPPAPAPVAAPENLVHLHAGKGMWTLDEVEQLLRELGFTPRRFTPDPRR